MTWGIVDEEDIATLEVIFHVVKKQVPAATVNTLMTDDGGISKQNLIRL